MVVILRDLLKHRVRLVAVLTLLLCILSLSSVHVWGGVKGLTNTEITETVFVQGRSVTKSFIFSDTSITDETVNVHLKYNITDKEFHDFRLEDPKGETQSRKGPDKTLELEVSYTLRRSYAQYWMKFSYAIDDYVEVKNNTSRIVLAPRILSKDYPIDKYNLIVKIPTYDNYMWRISVESFSTGPDSITEEGTYSVMKWQLSGDKLGMRVVIDYRYQFDNRELQVLLVSATVSALISLPIGVLFDRFILGRSKAESQKKLVLPTELRRRKFRARKGTDDPVMTADL